MLTFGLILYLHYLFNGFHIVYFLLFSDVMVSRPVWFLSCHPYFLTNVLELWNIWKFITLVKPIRKRQILRFQFGSRNSRRRLNKMWFLMSRPRLKAVWFLWPHLWLLSTGGNPFWWQRNGLWRRQPKVGGGRTKINHLRQKGFLSQRQSLNWKSGRKKWKRKLCQQMKKKYKTVRMIPTMTTKVKDWYTFQGPIVKLLG